MIDYLLGDALLGEGQAGAVGSKPRFLGPPYYLINDTFTTDRSAGAVNGTNAEPGPGKRTVTDVNSKLSLSGGAVSLATGSGTLGNSGLWLYGAGIRRAGLMLISQMTPTTATTAVGWDTDNASRPIDGVRFAGGSAIQAWANGSAISVSTWSGGTPYRTATILRATGCFIFARLSGNWILLWISAGGAISPMYPMLHPDGDLGVASCDYMRVPSALWLPTPLASDGFSAWGTSDGLGHAEGIAGGLGSGGNGKTWTNQIGTFGATGGAAQASALSGGIAAATVDSGKTDAITTAKVTRSAGVAGVLAAYVDANNHVRAVHNGTNAQLIKRVSGSDTNVISTAATYSANAEIRVIREGTAYRLYYNNALIGSQQTISDAVFNSVTTQGIYTTDTANTLDDFVVRARGTGGEYSALDNF